ncbi:hypothetical protein CRM90_27600 [Mycobacterium sp. ENV421]|uniref:8-oxoguanine DNA glycosylase OGG fold protein n=1 Tax=Mycobacterium sp. ENV421 TaxID=1213407 RepID=UPI000C9B97A1|nr:hypothetical protein [Mycobacterium sp. ENV421]PND54512.1 hypothetical protein CRM90_27600 [Mycobacterium sp. ENV421]
MSGVNEQDAGLVLPKECVAWCQAQDYGVSVCDDMAGMDLDWWNTRLTRHAIPTRIIGREADGAPADHGLCYLRRADLTGDLDTDPSAVPGSPDLAVLYRAAAWLSGHPDRDRRRCFPDVRTPASSGGELDAVTAALAACRHTPWQAIPDATSGRRWSGWAHTPGVGPAVVSLYLWVTHHVTPTVTGPLLRTSTAVRPVVGPQLLDQQAVTSLVHLGWVGEPVAARFTWGQYLRYCELLCEWATQCEVAVELVEMWLVRRWRERTATRRSLHTQWHR